MLETNVRKSGDNLFIGLSDEHGEVCNLMYYFYEDDLKKGKVSRKNLICIPNKKRDISISYDALEDKTYIRLDVVIAQEDAEKLIKQLTEASEMCDELRKVIDHHFPE